MRSLLSREFETGLEKAHSFGGQVILVLAAICGIACNSTILPLSATEWPFCHVSRGSTVSQCLPAFIGFASFTESNTRLRHSLLLLSIQTILPAAAQDVYYRDEIGNISTSHLLVLDDSVEMEIRPRFPLFGGWKTHYIIGYNLPSYEYLYNLGGWLRGRE